MSANGFLGGLLGRDAREDDDPGTHRPGEEIATTTRSSRRSGTRGAAPQEGHHQPPQRGLTAESLAGAIADLPEAVPRESAVLIVRKTLDAAGVRLSEVDESTRAQESRLSYEIGLAEDRQEELRQKTRETVRSLEEEVRKAREACEDVVAYEERKISRDRALLGEVRRVRAFFGLAEAEGEEGAGPAEGGTRQILEPSDVAGRRRAFDAPFGPGAGGG